MKVPESISSMYKCMPKKHIQIRILHCVIISYLPGMQLHAYHMLCLESHARSACFDKLLQTCDSTKFLFGSSFNWTFHFISLQMCTTAAARFMLFYAF
jgi:hypothetical protein